MISIPIRGTGRHVGRGHITLHRWMCGWLRHQRLGVATSPCSPMVFRSWLQCRPSHALSLRGLGHGRSISRQTVVHGDLIHSDRNGRWGGFFFFIPHELGRQSAGGDRSFKRSRSHPDAAKKKVLGSRSCARPSRTPEQSTKAENGPSVQGAIARYV